MKRGFAILFLLALFSCHHNSKEVTEVNGNVNPGDIAKDTLNQLAIEGSYEYSKTLPVAENLAYDIFAYGSPASGQYIIIRRMGNKTDTLVKAERKGIFEDAWLTHLNKNHKGEIIIVNRLTSDSTYRRNLLVYAINNDDGLMPIEYFSTQEIMDGNDKGRDSFYIQGSQVIRQYPLYATGDAICCPSGGRIRVHYEMKNDSLTAVGKMDMDIQ